MSFNIPSLHGGFMDIEFKAWPKIGRGKGQRVIITEKLDGTNACVVIQEGKIVGVQSRKRFITPSDDNYGFATWVDHNEEELLKLGDGYHYGEWYGLGIQKNPHKAVGKRFALFNTLRWGEHNKNTPECVEVVPVLHDGVLDITISDIMRDLQEKADNEEYTPEGVVAFYCNTQTMEKYTFKTPKGKWVNK
jgi:hypothetical protein